MIFIGDVHGRFERLRHYISQYQIEQRNFIQVGDFGLGFQNYKEDVAFLYDFNRFLQERQNVLYIIRGNHDNKIFWKNADLFNLNNIKLVKDYTVLDLEGKTVLFIGGGISINRIMLEEGKDYWNDEYVVTDSNRLNLDSEVDMIVTHIAPFKFWPREHTYLTAQYMLQEEKLGRNLGRDLYVERDFMDSVLFKLRPRHWIYGHYHQNKIESIRIDCGMYTTAVCVGCLQFYDYRTGTFVNTVKVL